MNACHRLEQSRWYYFLDPRSNFLRLPYTSQEYVSTSFGLFSTQERLHEVPQLRPLEVICHVGPTATATGWSPVGDGVVSLLTSMNDTLHTLFNKHDRLLRYDAVWGGTNPYDATSQKTITSTFISLRYSVSFHNFFTFNPLNPELNPICYLLALLAHHFLHVSRRRVKSLTIRLLMSYIYGAPILDVSRSHTTTQHSR